MSLIPDPLFLGLFLRNQNVVCELMGTSKCPLACPTQSFLQPTENCCNPIKIGSHTVGSSCQTTSSNKYQKNDYVLTVVPETPGFPHSTNFDRNSLPFSPLFLAISSRYLFQSENDIFWEFLKISINTLMFHLRMSSGKCLHTLIMS